MASAPTAVSDLLGRDRELSLARGQLADARTGAGTALMFFGEPGSGKTSLLSGARQLADDFLIVSCRGVEWEAELPFSGLHELLGPLLGTLEVLPEPQRQALEGALGLAPIESLHTLNVYAGAFSLLVEATRTRPVLIVVDDLQWIDSTTIQVLSFIARRLAGEPLAMLIGSRPGTELAGLAAQPVELAPLDRAAVAELAGRHLGRPLPDSAVVDLSAASAGNPLAVLESVRHFGEELWLRGSLLDGPLPVGELIERGFSDRIAALPDPARAALEVVAASVTDDAATITAALGRLDLAPDTLVAAERAEILLLQAGRVEFAHPLLRALVHRLTGRDRLRSCHAALAEVATAESGLRAWHAASAQTTADESIAAALDAAAKRFAVRGGFLAAAQALARSAELTPDLDTRAGRLLRCGTAAYHAGRSTWANTLFAEACDTAVDPKLRVSAEWQRARSDAHLVASHDVGARFLAVAEQARGIDDDLCAHALVSSAIEGVISGRMGPMIEAARLLSELRQTCSLSDEQAREADATEGIIRVLTGVDDSGEGHALITGTVEGRLTAESGNHEYVAEALVWIEEFDLSERLCDHLLQRVRAQGDVFTQVGALWADGYRRYRTGDWQGAEAALTESSRIADTIELRMDDALALAMLSIVHAAQGKGDFRASTPQWEEAARRYGFGIIDEYTRTALGLLELGAGRGAEAAVELERARARMTEAGQIAPCVLPWPADLVDAYFLAGDLSKARELLEELRTRSLVANRPWACAAVARLDGLLADEDSYEAHFELAFQLYDRTRAPFDRARAHLAFGQRLRRSRRRVEAREHLSAALEEFERLGAAPWAEQARREMGASSATLRKRAGVHHEELTPQERQVAQLVARGSSNKQVAGSMFLSPKTVENHLGRIYRKLGVNSRTQLAARMRDDEVVSA